MTFEDIIVTYRKELGLTQEALANKLGVTNQAVSKWESGQSCPDIALLPQIADLFGITIDALFGREAKTEPKREELPWPDDGTMRVVLYAGHELLGNGHQAAKEIHFCYEGPALNIHSAVNVTCEAVNGDLTAGGSVNCEAVNGSLTAGGEVNCEAVYGSVTAGGCVNCEDVYGSVTAQGDVSCEDVSGNVDASGEVNCSDVEGDVRSGGDTNCECVDGDIHAGGDVNCDEASGNITAGGDVYCDHWER